MSNAFLLLILAVGAVRALGVHVEDAADVSEVETEAAGDRDGESEADLRLVSILLISISV
jgi:hypothetical protein